MPQCPKCYINAFHNNVCNRCGYVEKKNEVKTSEISINENEHKEEKIEINGNENTHTPKSENNNLITCPDCKKEISRNAEACPHCGAPNKALSSKKSLNIFYIIILVFVFVIFFMFTDTGKMMFNSDYKECRKVLNEALCREVHIYN